MTEHIDSISFVMIIRSADDLVFSISCVLVSCLFPLNDFFCHCLCSWCCLVSWLYHIQYTFYKLKVVKYRIWEGLSIKHFFLLIYPNITLIMEHLVPVNEKICLSHWHVRFLTSSLNNFSFCYASSCFFFQRWYYLNSF